MAKDPYKYFRIEARELIDGLGQGLLELEKGGPGRDLANRLLRGAHTLKGAARVVRQAEIAEAAHRFEDLFIPFRDAEGPPPRGCVDELFQLVDRMMAALNALDPQEPAAGAPSEAEVREDAFRTIRVQVEELDGLLDGIGEAGVGLAALRGGLAEVQEALGAARSLGDLLSASTEAGLPLARARALAAKVRTGLERGLRDLDPPAERVDQELVRARDTAQRMRLLPAGTIFATLERAARDAARSLQKEVRFEASGGENRLDAHVLGGVQDLLLHLVRNAVAHGVEPPSERVAAGKAPAGALRVLVERRGQKLRFLCQDDGRGFDLDRIRSAALRRHLVSPSEAAALDLDHALRLFARGGVSTSERPDEISGRGIGLEAVASIAGRLKGELRARSEAGRGSSLEVEVPLSLASMPALVVESAGQPASIPLDSVRTALRVACGDFIHSAEGPSIPFEDRAIPFLPLSLLLDQASPRDLGREAWSAVVVQAQDLPVAVGVDRILGTAEVVMKPLPSAVGAVRCVAGASFYLEGNPRLVLGPAGVAEALFARRVGPLEAGIPEHPRVLVVDDSLTTRMLEQSILESAGYEVDVAVSGEEGLRKAREKAYRIILVDVEMPGMDGFEFVARVTADPALGHVPCILVTSRDAPEDKRRGAAAGARAYIVKSEFDESGFLAKIEDLIR